MLVFVFLCLTFVFLIILFFCLVHSMGFSAWFNNDWLMIADHNACSKIGQKRRKSVETLTCCMTDSWSQVDCSLSPTPAYTFLCLSVLKEAEARRNLCETRFQRCSVEKSYDNLNYCFNYVTFLLEAMGSHVSQQRLRRSRSQQIWGIGLYG